MTSRTTPYNHDFFKKRAAWEKDYKAIAAWLQKNIDGQTFGDVGCGNGSLIAHLANQGKTVWGVDSADTSDLVLSPKIKGLVKSVDVTSRQKLAPSDVVLCFEVGERIDKKHADTLVENIVSTSARTIVFTAAEPGQAGVHHINLQPKKYWLDKFKQHGYCLDRALTHKFTSDLEADIENLTWYLQDILILQKCDDPQMVEIMDRSDQVIRALAAEVADLKLINQKMKHEYWMTAQRLNGILASARWKATAKLLRIVRK